MLFVLIAGVELDLHPVWRNRRETAVTAGLALAMPLLLGAVAALAVVHHPGWIGGRAGHGSRCSASAWRVP
jgi:Kef-type K+ transport system membrane component KefB